MYEAPNWNALNQSVHSQIQACISKSCELCALMRYYTTQSGTSLLTLQDNLSPLLQTSRYPKENTAKLKLLTQSFLFFWEGGGLHPLSNFFFKEAYFRSRLRFRFQANKHLIDVPLRLTYSQSLHPTESVTC